MSNPFFTNTIDLLPATKAKAGDVEANLNAVEAGFDEVKEYFDRSLRGARANPAIAEIPNAATRANKVLSFDGSGNPDTSITASEVMNAQNYATNAQASATAAAGSASSAAASFDSFDDRYLGAKSSDPALDNDGNALLTGAMYWNSVAGEMRVWSGSEWIASYLPESSYVAKSGDTMTGGLDFSGAGLRLTGDFSNATVANRLAFQTSTTNGLTIVPAIPNGTSTIAGFAAYSHPTNGAAFAAYVTGGEAILAADKIGSGSYTPMTFYTSGIERMRINTDGSMVAGHSVAGGVAPYRLHNASGTANSTVALSLDPGNNGFNTRDAQIRATNNGLNQISMSFYVSDSETPFKALEITRAGAVLATKDTGGVGYGTGAGGTVTQATSKSTTVTLNKPCGAITMNNAALAAGAAVSFGFSNSSIGFQDIVDLQVVGGAATRGTYEVWADQSGFGAGSVAVFVKNISAGNLSEAVVLSFAVKKVATS